MTPNIDEAVAYARALIARNDPGAPVWKCTMELDAAIDALNSKETP